MAFAINDLVWFKKRGSTPFVTGDPIDPTIVVGSELNGRGKPNISKGTPINASGFSDAQGVPTIDYTKFPPALSSLDASDNTIDVVAGEHLGVTEQISSGNPLAPKKVFTDGVFDGPTPQNLFNPALDAQGSPIDEGRTDTDAATKDYVDTIRDIDPDFSGGRTAASGAAKASGDVINLSGVYEFKSEIIDQKTPANRVGRRQPSSLEDAGRVVQIVTVVHAGKSPDGTAVIVGSKMYWVNWGTSDPSNPHKVKFNNRFRVQLHAEADLISAP